MRVDEVTWATGPRDAFQSPRTPGRVLRWEDPPPPRHRGRERYESQYEAVAVELRGRPGVWGVVYDGPARFASALQTHIRTGAVGAFAPAGDFDACARLVSGQRVVYARYLGDGDL